MCSLCTPQFVLRPPFSKHLIISPPVTGFWAATAFGPSSCVWCSHAFGHRVSGTWGCGACSVWCRVFYCCHRVWQGLAKQPRVLKKVTIAQRVEKYSKYGLYDNNGALYCKPCGKKMDETREDSLTKHVTSGIHDAKFVLAAGYEQREASPHRWGPIGGADQKWR